MARYWWTADPAERTWVEIRYVEGIGANLRAPMLDVTGRENAWYELVDQASPGDYVYHWQPVEHRFVGRSRVAGAVTANQSTGERSRPLRGFVPLVGNIDRSAVLAMAPQLIAARDALRSAYVGEPLYLPFQFRADGLRLMSNYFTKLPRSMSAILFGDDGLASGGSTPPAPSDGRPITGDEEGPRTIFLQPFQPKADSDYVAKVAGGPQVRGRAHESLVNEFAAWLIAHGHNPGRNVAVDLGLTMPLVIIEAKVVLDWPSAIRQAVGQLYEYRHFRVADPAARLVFLASERPPKPWIDYLEGDRDIAVCWRTRSTFEMTALCDDYLGLP